MGSISHNGDKVQRVVQIPLSINNEVHSWTRNRKRRFVVRVEGKQATTEKSTSADLALPLPIGWAVGSR